MRMGKIRMWDRTLLLQRIAEFLQFKFFALAHNMASCEETRSSAYGEDLRWRMIWQTQGLEYSVEKVAMNLNIDKSTVYRTVQRFLSTGSIAKYLYPTERAAKKLTDPTKLFILQLVLEKPGITLREIQEQLLYTLLIVIDIAKICRFLQQSGFTRQKLQITALQRSEHLRQCYIEEVSIYNPDMLIFFG